MLKTRKILVILLFILFALPIPLSLISWIGTIISVANMSMINWSILSECLQGIVAVIAMLLAGTYLVSYIISLCATWKNKKITIISFLPLFHIVLFSIFYFVGVYL